MKKYFLVVLTKEEKKYLLFGGITGVLYSTMLVAIPFLISQVLGVANQIRMKSEKNTAIYLIVGIIIFSLVTMIIYSLHQLLVNKFILSLRLDIEKKYIERMIDDEGKSAEIINVINEDIRNICELHYQKIFNVINSSAFIAMGMIYSMVISVVAFGLELAFICVCLFLQIKSKKLLNERFSSYRETRIKEIQKINSYISSKLTFISYNAYDFALGKVSSLICKKSNEEKRVFLIKRSLNLCLSILPSIGTLVSCLVICNEILQNTITAEEGMAIIYVIGYILWEVIKLVNVKINYTSLEKVESELKKLYNTPKKTWDKTVDDITTKIKIENMTVIKEERVILNNISFTFEGGKKYILIGKSGSGKSTLIKTIIGQLDYDGRINEMSSRKYNLNTLINYLPQEAEIIPENIYSNVTLSNKCDSEKVDSIISKMNFNTMHMSSNAEILSGGEIKKVEFARGLYYLERKTWILDEPLEGVDLDSRECMEKIIDEYDGGIILASHIYTRSMIDIFDELLIFEEGNLVFSGKYDMLPKSLQEYYFDEGYRG